MATQTYRARHGWQSRPLWSIFLSLLLVTGVILLLRACIGSNATVAPANDHTGTLATAAPAMAPTHGPAPTMMPDASKYPAGTPRDVMKDAPPGWVAFKDCHADHMRTWAVFNGAGDIVAYVCKP